MHKTNLKKCHLIEFINDGFSRYIFSFLPVLFFNSGIDPLEVFRRHFCKTDEFLRLQDTDALNRAHRAISNLQSELEKLKSTTEFLIDENTNKTKQLADLVETTAQLEERKADKDFVEAGLELVSELLAQF